MVQDEIFAMRFIQIENEARLKTGPRTNTAWTSHVSGVVAKLGRSLGLHPVTKGTIDRWGRSEYLTIDAMLFESGHPLHCSPQGTAGPFPHPGDEFSMPAVTVEIENHPGKVGYDYWKLLCVRSKLRVLAFVVPQEEDEQTFVNALGRLRTEHSSLDGEDLLLVGRFGMAWTDPSVTVGWSAHVWRTGAFIRLQIEERLLTAHDPHTRQGVL